MQNHDKLHADYERDHLRYWENKASKLVWTKKWDSVWDDGNSRLPKWFSGGDVSLCYNVLDRQVNDGFGNDVAVIFDSPFTKEVKRITYNELLNKVSLLAGAFANRGLKVGDRVLIFMPMIPETLYSMLACNRLGLVYTVLQGRFGNKVIVEKLEDFKPNATIVVNGEYGNPNEEIFHCKDLLDAAMTEISEKPTTNFVLQRPQIVAAKLNRTRDVDFEIEINKATAHGCVSVEANSPIFILHTSGTTGKPKGVVHTVKAVAMGILQDDGEMCMSSTNDISFWNTSYVWIIGQIYLCYYPLFWRLPIVLYEGTTFNIVAAEIYRLMATYAITTASFSIPAIRCMKMQDRDGSTAKKFKPFSLKKLLVSSAPADETTMNWASQIFDVPVCQHYGATETGGAISVTSLTSNNTQAHNQLSVGKPLPGWDVTILMDNGDEAKPGEYGNIALKFPLHPMVMETLNQSDQQFYETYLKKFHGYFDMKDYGKIDKDRALWVAGRADAVFKFQGHRISCGEIEEAILKHPDVAECVVVTRLCKTDEVNHEIPEIFYICKNGAQTPLATISKELIDIVKHEIGSFLTLNTPMKVEQLPRTVTGKVARGTIQNLLRSHKPEHTRERMEQDIPSLIEAIKIIHHRSG